MRKIIINIICVFIPSKDLRHKLRDKIQNSYTSYSFPYKIRGKNNKIIIVKNGVERKLKFMERISGLNIFIKGEGNQIIFHTPLPHFIDSSIYLVGDNNTIEIGSSSYIVELDISCQWECHNRMIKIGDNFSCERTKIVINEDNATLNIGQDCMFSNFIEIRTDGHAIINKKGDILNSDCNITIGNHCWVATRCILLKSANLPNGCILGAGSLLSKKFQNENSIYAGIPAKQIKENISWMRENASILKRKKNHD